MEPDRKLATYDDLLALSEDVRAEVLAGDLIVQPSALPRHSRVQRALGSFIGRPFDDDDGRGGPGGWWILQEVDVRFGPNDIVRPDVVGWRRDRLPAPWNVRPIDTVPDWVCEILSPSSQGEDRVRKRYLYARHGVPHYWIVDPEARTLEAQGLVNGVWMDAGSHDDSATAHIPPFEAVALEVGRLFPPPAGPDAPGG